MSSEAQDTRVGSIQFIADTIKRMGPEELTILRYLLGDDGPDLGIREPVRPDGGTDDGSRGDDDA